jgi:hypothetical protein
MVLNTLPPALIIHIYEYDDTYRIEYKKSMDRIESDNKRLVRYLLEDDDESYYKLKSIFEDDKGRFVVDFQDVGRYRFTIYYEEDIEYDDEEIDVKGNYASVYTLPNGFSDNTYDRPFWYYESAFDYPELKDELWFMKKDVYLFWERVSTCKYGNDYLPPNKIDD